VKNFQNLPKLLLPQTRRRQDSASIWVCEADYGSCYGSRYLVDNHFISLKSIPANERLKTQKKEQLSLFHLTEKKPAATRAGFTVTADAIKNFLRLNHDQLRCGRHRVANDVLKLNFVDMPAQLVLESCEEQGDWCYLAGWYDLGNRRIRLSDLLDAAARKKALLTGTPVENRIEELETLLSICLPDLLAITGIRQQFRTASTPEARRKLQTIISPFILRRTRGQVLSELPERSEDIRLCTLSPDQVTVYRQAVKQVKGTVDEFENEVLDDFTHILTTIMRLKQICNHLCLLQKCTD